MQVLLDVSFIFTLLDFAKRGLMIDKEKSNIDKLAGQPTTQKKEQQATDGATIQVDIVLNEPRIALLEDASKPNSKAIVLQVRGLNRTAEILFRFYLEQFSTDI